MTKAADAVRTIGEVSLELDIKPHILRYWEEQFPALKPMKRSGGRRYYRTDDITLLRRIDTLLNKEGYTIKGAKKVLSGKAAPAPAAAVSPATIPSANEETKNNPHPAAANNAAINRELQSIRKLLQEALG